MVDSAGEPSPSASPGRIALRAPFSADPRNTAGAGSFAERRRDARQPEMAWHASLVLRCRGPRADRSGPLAALLAGHRGIRIRAGAGATDRRATARPPGGADHPRGAHARAADR